MHPVEILGFIGGGIGMFFGLPQVLEIRRQGHGNGVSLVSWILLFGVSTSWAAYGFHLKSPSASITNIGAALISGSLIVALVPKERKPILWLVAYAAALSTLVLTLPPKFVNALLIALVFAQTPQVIKSYRNFRLRIRSVVSLKALGVSTASVICWIAYALLADIPLIAITSYIALSINLTIVTLEVLARRRSGVANPH